MKICRRAERKASQPTKCQAKGVSVDVTSPIENWVILSPGVERRLRFSGHRIVTKTITDPVTRGAKTVETLEFDVALEDGAPSGRRALSPFPGLSSRAGRIGL